MENKMNETTLELMESVDRTMLLEILWEQAKEMLENDYQDNGNQYNPADVTEMVYSRLLEQKGQKYITCFNEENYIRAKRDLYNRYMANGKMLKLIKIYEKYLSL